MIYNIFIALVTVFIWVCLYAGGFIIFSLLMENLCNSSKRK